MLIDLTSDDGFLIAGFVNVNCLPTLLHHLFTLKTHELVKLLIYLVEQFPKSFDSKKSFFSMTAMTTHINVNFVLVSSFELVAFISLC